MKKSDLKRSLSKSVRAKYWISNHAPTRFRKFQQCLLKADLAPEIHLLLSLFAFDGLRTQDFKLAIKSAPLKYEGSKIGIGWIDDFERQNRIRLGNFSLRLMESVNWESVQSLSLATLTDYYSHFAGRKNTLKTFARDQQAWFSEISSGILQEHFSGMTPLTALSDTCYARQKKFQALAFDQQQIASAESVVYQALEGWLESDGNDQNPIFIDRIVQVCRRGRIDDKINHKWQMLKSCRSLTYEASDAGPITSLVLAWVVDLIENGTQFRTNIAISTIVNYVSVLAKPLYVKIRGQNIQDWSLAQFEEIYSLLITESSDGQKKNMASGINCWHRFLVGWIDVQPLKRRLHDEVPNSIPSANVLWPHEYELIQDWLRSSVMDKRLILYLRAMFSLAFKVRIRINELLTLRLNDLQFYGDILQIRIRGTKSAAAKRRVEISASDCAEFVELIHHRKSELAIMEDFIFADPNQLGKLYKFSKLYTHSNELLKAATGDSSIRFHSLSHSVISFRLQDFLVGGSDDLINPLHQLATDFGHFSIMTSCSEYMHYFEDAIRETIDRDMARIKITSKIAARWSRKSADSIRKQVSRAAVDKNSIYFRVIQECANSPQVEDVCHDQQLMNPIPPRFLGASESFSLSKILDVLTDIQDGTSVGVIARRLFIDDEMILKIILASKRVLLKCKYKGVDFKSASDQIINKLKNLDWLDFKKARDYKNLNTFKAVIKNQHLIKKGIDAWCLLNVSGYFSLTDELASFEFLEMLSTLGISVSHLAIAHSPECKNNQIRRLQALFFKFFKSSVPTFEVTSRRGRPSVYLLIASARISAHAMPPTAVLSTSGINAVLFATAVAMEFDDAR